MLHTRAFFFVGLPLVLAMSLHAAPSSAAPGKTSGSSHSREMFAPHTGANHARAAGEAAAKAGEGRDRIIAILQKVETISTGRSAGMHGLDTAKAELKTLVTATTSELRKLKKPSERADEARRQVEESLAKADAQSAELQRNLTARREEDELLLKLCKDAGAIAKSTRGYAAHAKSSADAARSVAKSSSAEAQSALASDDASADTLRQTPDENKAQASAAEERAAGAKTAVGEAAREAARCRGLVNASKLKASWSTLDRSVDALGKLQQKAQKELKSLNKAAARAR